MAQKAARRRGRLVIANGVTIKKTNCAATYKNTIASFVYA